MESADRTFDFGITDEPAPAKGGRTTNAAATARVKKSSGDLSAALAAEILVAIKEQTFAVRALTAQLARDDGRCVARPDWRPPVGRLR